MLSVPGEAAGVVVIEDNPADVYLICQALRESLPGLDILCFNDGEEALAALAAVHSPARVPDLFVLDLHMPRSDGRDILARIRRDPRLANVPIAILSSSVSPEERQHVSQFPHTRFLYKPTELQEFFDTVGNAAREMIEASRKH